MSLNDIYNKSISPGRAEIVKAYTDTGAVIVDARAIEQHFNPIAPGVRIPSIPRVYMDDIRVPWYKALFMKRWWRYMWSKAPGLNLKSYLFPERRVYKWHWKVWAHVENATSFPKK